jgi:hypothetical protein
LDTIARFAKITVLLLAISSASGTPIKDRPIVIGQKPDTSVCFVIADEQQKIENKNAEDVAQMKADIRNLQDRVSKLEGGQ